MARRSDVLELPLPGATAPMPAYRALYEALRAAILARRLKPGARLPGSRELARQQAVSRGTAVAALEMLAAEGYVSGAVGSGTFVANDLPDSLFEVPESAAARPNPSRSGEPKSRQPAVSGFARRVRSFPNLGPRRICAFRSNLPALDLFPTALWAQLASRRHRRMSARQLEGCEPFGLPELRAAIADYLVASRGVRCEAAQIAVLSGAQEALDFAARLLIEPGDAVGVEEPGYPAAALALEAAGARIRPIPVDDEGMTVPSARTRGIRLLYSTPAHQYPLGVAMSLRRRGELLDWGRRAGAWIFEDDYDGEYRYSGRPLPALQGLDGDGRVLYAGSFNKVLFPSLRLGYLVLPPALVDAAAAARSITARHPPVLEQLVLLDFLAAGHFGRHVRRMRGIYAGRLEALLEGARSELAEWLAISPVEAGLQTVGRLAPGLSGPEVERAAALRGVEVVQLERHWRGAPAFAGLQLGFAAVDERELARGTKDLAAVLAGLAPRPGGRRP